jgi:hypothetical protein
MKPMGFSSDHAALVAVAVRIAIIVIIALTGVASAHS